MFRMSAKGVEQRPVRVLLVDDHEMFASSLALALSEEPDLMVVGTCGSRGAALDGVRTNLPDVVLLDRRLPDGDGVQVIRALLEARPGLQVVVVTASASDQALLEAVEAGAVGVVDKTASVEEVLAAVRAAAAGHALLSPKLTARLMSRLHRQQADPAEALTEREQEVLELLGRGLSNPDIARRLTLSVHTVRNHVASIAAKLGAHSKLEVLSIAISRGLLNSSTIS